MCKQSNFHGKKFFAALLVVAFVLPSTSFAAGRGVAAARTKVNFCTAVDAFAEKLKKDTSDNISRFSVKESERQSALDEKLAKQDAERQNSRFTWDNSRDKVYSELALRATTQSQKAAIEKFKNAIDAAVEARRASVDKATADFKFGVDKGISNRKTLVASSTLLFNTETTAALTNAKADCAGGKAPADARAAYVAALDAAQKKLQSSLSQVKTTTALKVLITTRQAAIEQAAKDFKASVTKAENSLKLAFPDA